MKKRKFSIRRSHRNGVPFHPFPEEPSMVFEKCFRVASRYICRKDFTLKHHLFRSSTQIRPKLLANPRQPIKHLVSFCLRIVKNFWITKNVHLSKLNSLKRWLITWSRKFTTLGVSKIITSFIFITKFLYSSSKTNWYCKLLCYTSWVGTLMSWNFT